MSPPVEGGEPEVDWAAIREVFASRMPSDLKKYWLAGAGAAKIRWGTDGDFNRCVRLIQKEVVEDGRKPLADRVIKGLCANLHRERLGKWPGEH